MDGSATTWWWVATGALVALELATGTFYLLMLALGAAGGALAAMAGLGGAVPWVAAALLGGGATAVLHWRRRQHPRDAAATPAPPPHMQLDLGAQVQVDSWHTDGSARVQHRGTQWQARLADGGAGQPGLHRIVAVDANWLVLQPVPHPANAAPSQLS